MAPWADLLYACDLTWWRYHFPLLATKFSGELWTISEVARDQFGLRWMFGADRAGLSQAADYIHTGKNSGYQAIGLAYLFGAARIVLAGFDFGLGPQGERHWHGDHPRPLGNGAGLKYSRWCRAMDVLAEDIKRTPCKVVNASARTALRCFQRATLENALHEIRSPDRIGNPRGLPQLQHLEVR